MIGTIPEKIENLSKILNGANCDDSHETIVSIVFDNIVEVLNDLYNSDLKNRYKIICLEIDRAQNELQPQSMVADLMVKRDELLNEIRARIPE